MNQPGLTLGVSDDEFVQFVVVRILFRSGFFDHIDTGLQGLGLRRDKTHGPTRSVIGSQKEVDLGAIGLGVCPEDSGRKTRRAQVGGLKSRDVFFLGPRAQGPSNSKGKGT